MKYILLFQIVTLANLDFVFQGIKFQLLVTL